jgi:hypothetical protein
MTPDLIKTRLWQAATKNEQHLLDIPTLLAAAGLLDVAISSQNIISEVASALGDYVDLNERDELQDRLFNLRQRWDSATKEQS